MWSRIIKNLENHTTIALQAQVFSNFDHVTAYERPERIMPNKLASQNCLLFPNHPWRVANRPHNEIKKFVIALHRHMVRHFLIVDIFTSASKNIKLRREKNKAIDGPQIKHYPKIFWIYHSYLDLSQNCTI